VQKYVFVRRFLLILLFTLPVTAAEIRVSAAASLTDAVTELAKLYEAKSGDTIVLNFGASSILATQIVNGAPADLFISADEVQMNRVATVVRVPLLSNQLVIVGMPLLKARRIAIANPEAVPAGVYAKKWLQQRGFWAFMASKIIPTENVRGALAAVEAGNADSAIVYATDAKIARRVRIAEVINDGPPIVYPAAVLRDAQNAPGARRFLEFLQSRDAGAVFRRDGFIVK
jgi:molybdate transport system substrate-binding protein